MAMLLKQLNAMKMLQKLKVQQEAAGVGEVQHGTEAGNDWST